MSGKHDKMCIRDRAVTWEQEPQTLKVWFRQRTRWVKGNIYVLIKNLPLLCDPKAKKVRFDILYFLSIYFLLLTSLVVSDGVLLLNMLGTVSYTHLAVYKRQVSASWAGWTPPAGSGAGRSTCRFSSRSRWGRSSARATACR